MLLAHWSYDAATLCFGLFLAAFTASRLALPAPLRQRARQATIGATALFVLALPTAIVTFIVTHQDLMLTVFTSHWCMVPALLAGPVLYWFRCRSPLAYGVIEIVASWVMIMVAIQATGGGGPSLPQAIAGEFPFLTKGIGVLGGIYVTVRGFDNIDKEVPARFRRAWRQVFPKPGAAVAAGTAPPP